MFWLQSGRLTATLIAIGQCVRSKLQLRAATNHDDLVRTPCRIDDQLFDRIDLVFTNWENEENPPARTRDTLLFSFNSFLQKLHLDVLITCGSVLRFGLTNYNMVTWLKSQLKT